MLQLTREQGQVVKIGETRIVITQVQRNKVKIELTRQVGELIGLGEQTKIKVISCQRKQVRLGIEAPKEVPIIREESEHIKSKNKYGKILVVEDEPISQKVVKIALENMGYEVDISDTGDKALALFAKNNYALILMDYGLPDTTGIDITYKMREFEKDKSKHTPIIALTAHGEAARAECLTAGMDDFIAKPFELNQLNKLVEKWVRK